MITRIPDIKGIRAFLVDGEDAFELVSQLEKEGQRILAEKTNYVIETDQFGDPVEIKLIKLQWHS